MAQLKSVHISNNTVDLIFHNDTNTPVSALWIDYQGKEIEYSTIDVGETFGQQTYAGHVWRFKTNGGQLVGHFIPTKKTPNDIQVKISDLAKQTTTTTNTTTNSTTTTLIPKVSGPKVVHEALQEIQVPHIKSASGRATSLIFSNQSNQALTYFWIDYEGKERQYGRIVPNATTHMTTSTKHPWVFRTDDGKAVGFFVADDNTPDSFMYTIGKSPSIQSQRIETDELDSCYDTITRRNRAGWQSKCFQEDPLLYTSLLNQLKRNGKRFIDCEFPPEQDWTNASEFFESECQLFVDGVSPGDILQGQVGNCWLMQSIAGAATKSSAIEDIFQYCSTPECVQYGLYILRMFFEGSWVLVVLDGFLPTDSYGSLKYARMAQDGEIWVCLLEKAFAKLSGGYDKLEASKTPFSPSSALVAMLGGKKREFAWGKLSEENQKKIVNSGKFWPMVEDIRNKGGVIVCTSRDHDCNDLVDEYGLVKYHGYSILDIRHFGDIHLIQIRNTWGRTEWRGSWSDGSKEWSKYPHIKNAVESEVNDDGIFWMSCDDFVVHYTVLWWNEL